LRRGQVDGWKRRNFKPFVSRSGEGDPGEAADITPARGEPADAEIDIEIFPAGSR